MANWIPPPLSVSKAEALGGQLAVLISAFWLAVGLPEIGQTGAAAFGSVLTLLFGWLIGRDVKDDDV
jgi:hypothetical protein